jgi:hypothetical protein
MAKRVDDHGRALKKSQLQIQIAVNRHRRELEQKILEALPTLKELDPVLEWISPLENERFAELWDERLLERMGRPDLADKLTEYWPKQGPHWDAGAVARTKDGTWLGPVLIEAKSYPEEMRSSCAAKDGRELIEARLRETREWLRQETGDPSEGHAEAWIDRYYQAANRLAFLYFFNEVIGEKGWLVNVLVVDDPDPDTRTSMAEWQAALPGINRELGVYDEQVPELAHVFIEGRPRSELVD